MSTQKRIATILLLVITWGLSAQQVIRGPYLQSAGSTSIILKWRTDQPTTSSVWLGRSPNELSASVSENGSTTEHEVVLQGLTPATKYYYAVGSQISQLAGADPQHYFTTSPTVGTEKPMNIWVMGDGGTANDDARNVRDGYYDYIDEKGTDMILMLGDNAYTSGTDAEYQVAVFEDMYEDMLIHAPLWSCPGNHEYMTANNINKTGPYYDIFTFPTNGEIGGLPSGNEGYYSFDYGNVHFISLDSQDKGISPGESMLVWLENDLNATNQDWIIVFFHFPPYSKGSHDSDSDWTMTKMRENIVPILEAGGVDLVLTGHSHSYERSYLINGHYGYSNTFSPEMMVNDGDGRTDGDGAYRKLTEGVEINKGSVYIVAGNAGKSNETALNHPAMFYSSPALGSLSLELEGDQLDLKFINIGGEVLDYFSMRKVGLPVGAAPIVSISYPNSSEDHLVNQSIPVYATAYDVDNDLVKVEFYVNDIYTQTDYEAPYQFAFSPTVAGSYLLSAKATDEEGNATYSNVAVVNIINVPIDPDPGEGLYILTFPMPISLNTSGTTAAWEEPLFATDCQIIDPNTGSIPGDCPPVTPPNTIILGQLNNSQYVYYSTPSTWQEAKTFSESIGGTLAIIENEEENDFLREVLPATTSWIGLSDEIMGGQFEWVSAHPMDYYNWGSWRPKASNGTPRYVQLLKTDGRWYDKTNEQRQAFIIEIACTADNIEVSDTLKIPGAITVTQTSPIPNGGIFPTGISTVTYLASDVCGNTLTASFTVTVPDSNPPDLLDSLCIGTIPVVAGFSYLTSSTNANFYVSEEKFSWATGQQFCQSRGGYLACPLTMETNNLLLNSLSGINDYLMIGLSDEQEEEQLKWVNNSTYLFNNMDPLITNNPDFDYGLMNPWNGTWKLESKWVKKRVIMEVPCRSIEAATVHSANDPSSSTSLLVFPNPVMDDLNISVENGDPYSLVKITIRDAFGKIIFQSTSKPIEQKYLISTKDWPNGTYLINFQINHKRLTRRFIKMDHGLSN